ncbi:hypothetical protein [Azospirillum thiophilum]|nr:hypothetical protein [Azospirillum thiophilum]
MTSRMARIVHMGKFGGYVALLDGTLLELDGRMLWPSVEALTLAARRAGIVPSDIIADTQSTAPAASESATAVSAPAESRPGSRAVVRPRSGGLPLAA